jgi:hypothetical protein
VFPAIAGKDTYCLGKRLFYSFAAKLLAVKKILFVLLLFLAATMSAQVANDEEKLLDDLAEMYSNRQYKKGIELAEEEINLEKDVNPRLAYMYANLLFADGEKQQARKYYSYFVRIASEKDSALARLISMTFRVDKLYFQVPSRLRNKKKVMEKDNDETSEEEKDQATVNFTSIKEAPRFKTCEYSQDERKNKACFQEKINQHLSNEIDTRIFKKLLIDGTYRTQGRFTIDESGQIDDIMVRGVHPVLCLQLLAALERLPEVRPGTQGGTPVRVDYTIPLVLEIKT